MSGDGATLEVTGATVALLPVDGGRAREGTLAGWSTGPAGLATIAQVVVASEQDVTELVGRRVWVQVPTPSGGVRVLEMAARRGARERRVELMGVAVLTSEARRGSPRVAEDRPVTVWAREPAPLPARMVDLSRTGVRVVTQEAGSLDLDERVDVLLGDDAGEPVRMPAQVVRLGPTAGEVALAFARLTEAHRELLDRVVLTRLAAERR